MSARCRWPAGVDWILFPARVGSFDRETMFKPLRELIAGEIRPLRAEPTLDRGPHADWQHVPEHNFQESDDPTSPHRSAAAAPIEPTTHCVIQCVIR
jgi:hypothetical protein